MARWVWMALALGACKAVADDPDLSNEGPVLPDRCVEPVQWAPGTAVFAEQTDTVGVLGAEGVRLVVADFDGDGWPDLHISRGGDAYGDGSTDGVRRYWLLRNNKGQFEDVTASSGVRRTREGDPDTVERPGSVVAFGDIDNDGDLDVFTGVGDSDDSIEATSELMINNGDGTFSMGPQDSPLRATSLFPSGASFVDVDRDGNLDLWLPQKSSQALEDRLFLGDGAGGFVDGTAAAGISTKEWRSVSDLDKALAHSNAWSGAVCDLNGDGSPELMAASYGRAPNHLWLADGQGGYSNHSVASGYAFDHRDDWRDNESARCWCKHHPGDAQCDGVPAPERISCSSDQGLRWNHTYDRNAFRLGGNSGATMCRDVDNDGHVDLLTSEIVHWDVGTSSDPSELLFNDGASAPFFERPGNAATGLERPATIASWNDGIMTGALLDFDNDGWADVYTGNSDYEGTKGLLFHQDSPRSFSLLDPADGIDHNRSHGVAVADFDRDGDLDLVVGHSRSRCGSTGECYETSQVRYFDNLLGGNFVQIALRGGDGSNTMAVGARVTVEAGGISQVQEVSAGHGHYGAQSDATLHFGMHDACEATVTVRWPDGALSTQSFVAQAGYRYTLEQGQQAEALDE